MHHLPIELLYAAVVMAVVLLTAAALVQALQWSLLKRASLKKERA